MHRKKSAFSFCQVLKLILSSGRRRRGDLPALDRSVVIRIFLYLTIHLALDGILQSGFGIIEFSEGGRPAEEYDMIYLLLLTFVSNLKGSPI